MKRGRRKGRGKEEGRVVQREKKQGVHHRSLSEAASLSEVINLSCVNHSQRSFSEQPILCESL